MTYINKDFFVLHIAETIKGGIGSYLSELIPLQIQTYGPEAVTLIVPEGSGKYLSGVPEKCIIEFPKTGKRFLNTINLTLITHQFLKKKHISLIHIHSTYAGLLIRPLLSLNVARPKIVYCPHGWAFDRKSSSVSKTFISLIECWLAKKTDAIVCISKHEFNIGLIAGISENKLCLIENGISPTLPDYKFPISWPNDKIKLLFVGRFDYQKGLDLFLEAIANLDGVACAIIIGDYVVDNPKKIDPPKNVVVMGWKSREELQGFYLSADLLVMPSRWEGFGLTAIEAMRCKLPVLATDVGGLSDIIINNVTGILIPPNSSKAIYDAIISLDFYELKKLGVMARQRFEENFTAEHMLNKLSNLYKKLCI